MDFPRGPATKAAGIDLISCIEFSKSQTMGCGQKMEYSLSVFLSKLALNKLGSTNN